jgi:hypothetical protein
MANVVFQHGITYVGELYNNTDTINSSTYLWITDATPDGSESFIGGGGSDVTAIQDAGWAAQAVVMGSDALGAASGGAGSYTYTITINSSGGAGEVKFTDTGGSGAHTARYMLISEGGSYGSALPHYGWDLGANSVPDSGSITITNAAIRQKIV